MQSWRAMEPTKADPSLQRMALRLAQAREDYRAAHRMLCLVTVCGPVKTERVLSFWGAVHFRFSI